MCSLLTISWQQPFPLSLTICRMSYQSPGTFAPKPFRTFILYCLSSQAPKCFHMSTLTRMAPYLRLHSVASQLCFLTLGWPPCGPGADIYLRTTRYDAQAPPETQCPPRVVISPFPFSCFGLSRAEGNIDSFGGLQGWGCYCSQGTPSPSLNAF